MPSTLLLILHTQGASAALIKQQGLNVTLSSDPSTAGPILTPADDPVCADVKPEVAVNLRWVSAAI